MWRMRQRWNDLLFAHWPVAAAPVQALLPPGLEIDKFQGSAWLGVVPFWMDGVENRPVGNRPFSVPTTRVFSELNLRTYVRSRATGKPGVYFFSLDATSALAVIGARLLFHLPYYYATISRSEDSGATLYRSRRLLTRDPAPLDMRYRSTGVPLAVSPPGSLAYFLTERYCLFTTFAGRVLVGEIHHIPWPLEAVDAEIRVNELARPHGLRLPDCAPVLHFARRLEVYIWGLRVEQ
jgi:uncharacterized protein YqjF (DUF2071 family)